MPARFGWVDFAEEDRQRMLDVVQLFHEHDTVDELGIGVMTPRFPPRSVPITTPTVMRGPPVVIFQESTEPFLAGHRTFSKAKVDLPYPH